MIDEKIDEKYIYECNGQYQYDWCCSCQKPVHQIDIGGGVFGCEHCKNVNQIEVINVEKPQ
jgi:hypothetical protein